MKPEDLKRFQRTHRDWDGVLLKDDGILGPKTEWALTMTTLPQWRQDLVFWHLSHLGHAETAPNRSPVIDGWIRQMGLDPEDKFDDPWCAIMVSIGLRLYGLDPVFEGSASALSLGRSLHQISLSEALPGDVVYWPTNDKGNGHIETLIGMTDRAVVATVGGNVQNAVRSQFRTVTPHMKFATAEAKIDTPVIPVSAKLPQRVSSYASTR